MNTTMYQTGARWSHLAQVRKFSLHLGIALD
jgi:hypothetical protein